MKQVLTKLGQTKANIDLSGIATARSASLLCELLETQLLQNPRYTEPRSLMPFRQKFFSQYGQDGMQRYRVLSLGAEPRSLLIVYASARTADRQYLHAEVLALTP